jgi:hypothetical protein
MARAAAGFLFGSNIVKQFNHTNHIDVIARAHQLVMEGFKYMFDKQLVKVWSAPNYVRAQRHRRDGLPIAAFALEDIDRAVLNMNLPSPAPCLLFAPLVLPLRQRRRHYGAGRAPNAQFQDIRGSDDDGAVRAA